VVAQPDHEPANHLHQMARQMPHYLAQDIHVYGELDCELANPVYRNHKLHHDIAGHLRNCQVTISSGHDVPAILDVFSELICILAHASSFFKKPFLLKFAKQN
jgi:hypothetical protein